MKKFSLSFKALLVAVIVVTTVSCKKEQATIDTSQGEATLARIMNFKQQVDYYKTNPDVKDGESVTLDEAIWNIEALFNLTYAKPDLSYGRTETADTVLYLPVGSDNTVLLTDLTVFYGQMYEVVRNIYQGIELDNKQFLILDVEAGEQHGGQQAIKLHSIQGSVKGIPPTPPTPIQNGPFLPGLSWYYGINGGNDAGINPSDLDAADTLTRMLNYWLVPKAPANYEYVYSHIKGKSTTLDTHYNNPQTGFNNVSPRYCEFYKEYPTEAEKWLSPDQLNYYYFGERHLILNVLPTKGDDPIPSTHSVYKIFIEDETVKEEGVDVKIGHKTEAQYGKIDIVGHNSIIKEDLQ
ncbi:MAG: hypothetical protein IKO23_01370 [Bacteroidales bacterium]|nr:hypothetical protein [Bacteroidales bacterium]